MNTGVTNIVLAGLGGQGVLRAADILADAAFRAGYDVKQSEIHGMSQRRGSVTSDVRFGAAVLSPMVPPGQADLLVVMDESQEANNVHRLRRGGAIIRPSALLGGNGRTIEDLDHEEGCVLTRRTFNVALLGVLSARLPFEEALWRAAIAAKLPPRVHAENLAVFALGREAGRGQ